MRPNWNDGRKRRYDRGNWLPSGMHSMPVTRGLLVTVAAVFLAVFFTGGAASPLLEWLTFSSAAWWQRPWTLLTYPFVETPSFWLILTFAILYSYGGMLERAWGSLNYAVLFFVFSLIGAAAFVPGSLLFSHPVSLSGLVIPLAALVTAWAALDPELECCFWGVTVKAKIIAALWVGLLYFQFGFSPAIGPFLGLFILAAPAAALLYVRKLPRLNLGGYSGRRRQERDRWAPDLRDDLPPLRMSRPEQIGGERNPQRRRQAQREIESLRKLLGEDDDDRPSRLN